MANYPLTWDDAGKRRFETGVDRGVLYIRDTNGTYLTGVAWNGLTSVSESPEGAEIQEQYADNMVYLQMRSAEKFKCTINAFTYPDEFGVCDGTAEASKGVLLGQQSRSTFGICYRTKIGNDVAGQDAGYKLHLIYGLTASPSEKEYSTVNDSPEAMEFSWECSSAPVAVDTFKPLSIITIDSTQVAAEKLKAFEEILYGKASTAPKLPLPAEVIAHFAG